jgi:hypothetical protein
MTWIGRRCGSRVVQRRTDVWLRGMHFIAQPVTQRHVLSNIRSEVIDGSTLTFEGSSSNVVESVIGEGKVTQYVVNVYGSAKAPSQDILIYHLGIAGVCNSDSDCDKYAPLLGVPTLWAIPRFGIRINRFSRNIRVLSGTTYAWDHAPGCGIGSWAASV